MLSDVSLVFLPGPPLSLALLPALPLQRTETLFGISFSHWKVDISDSGSFTLWTLSLLSFVLSSLTALHLAGTELDAPHHCGHASLQQEERNGEWQPPEKLQQGLELEAITGIFRPVVLGLAGHQSHLERVVNPDLSPYDQLGIPESLG